MKHEPINYNNPLGISKREWTRVLGVNLALLLLVYGIATILTLCGKSLILDDYRDEINYMEAELSIMLN